MFSLDNFYSVLYTNILKPANFWHEFFYPFGTSDVSNITTLHVSYYLDRESDFHRHHCFSYDQEPLLENQLLNLNKSVYLVEKDTKYCRLFANSEKSITKKKFLKDTSYLDWYYFFHGFASLSWFNDALYYSSVDIQPKNLFLNLNRLVLDERNYRLLLVAKLQENNLLNHGSVSLHTDINSVKKELLNINSKLNKTNKLTIFNNLNKLNLPLTLDKINIQGQASADYTFSDYKLQSSSFWHIVTETVFYHDKLHLTEKIFKPIVHKRPFILVGAPKNLQYLKSYGFQSFDKWIDESYDDITDYETRIEFIVNQIKKLSSLDSEKIKKMQSEIKEVTDYNFNHFFGKFKKIIIDELIDNFISSSLFHNNTTYNINHHVNLNQIDFIKLKALFNS